jgi:hypothetical protein
MDQDEARRQAERTQDDARRQAQREAANNMGPANTNTWTTPIREAYETERARLRDRK